VAYAVGMQIDASLHNGPVTTNEMARLVRYHPESIRRAIREGRIHALPFGRSYRIPAEEVARILREGLPVDRDAPHQGE